MFVPEELNIQDWWSGAIAVGLCHRVLSEDVSVTHLAQSHSASSTCHLFLLRTAYTRSTLELPACVSALGNVLTSLQNCLWVLGFRTQIFCAALIFCVIRAPIFSFISSFSLLVFGGEYKLLYASKHLVTLSTDACGVFVVYILHVNIAQSFISILGNEINMTLSFRHNVAENCVLLCCYVTSILEP